MMKTVKQIADEIGVSRQAIHQKIKREPLSTSLQGYVSTVDGVLQIDVDGENLIKSAFTKDMSTTDLHGIASTLNSSVNLTETLVDMLKLDIEAKNRQIEDMHNDLVGMQRTIDAQQETIHTQAENIKDLTASLNAAQALHAGTIQAQLEASATIETSTTPEQNATLDDTPNSTRRWWQFWK